MPDGEGNSWNNGVRGEQILPLIDTDSSTMRVEAGPGTGKTFGLVRRVERILHPDGLGVRGRDVLVVAFNRVIAKELAAEIGARLRTFDHHGDPEIRTIHALCVQVIGEELRLLLPHERDAMTYDILEEFPALRGRYERADRADQALRDHEARHTEHLMLWQAARRWLDRHHARLVGDLPGLLLDRLEGGDFQDHSYLHVIVDEFQDLTPGEQQLMFRLRRRDGQFVALGDPRQSIYRFRGNDREGLAKLTQLAQAWGDGMVVDVPMNECQRCPAAVVQAANRLMALDPEGAMIPVSATAPNLHVVTWPDPHAEAEGMARSIVQNVHTHPQDRHLVMVTRRQFGFWLRDRIAAHDPALRVELSFSEGLLETWAVREAFLFFCLLVDPDQPTWRAWLAYKNSTTGEDYKANRRNADAYLRLLSAANDRMTEATIRTLAGEPRGRQRGTGGSKIWDRARRFVELSEQERWGDPEDPSAFIARLFDLGLWTGPGYVQLETARTDMSLVREKAHALLSEHEEAHRLATGRERLRAVAQRLRYQIATREPFAAAGTPDVQVATLWGAKGVTAEHVYIVGVCDEAIPGMRREEYPGTDADFIEEQRRLLYVSITRSKRTLVISRATGAATAEAMRMGLAVEPGQGYRIGLQMSRFLRDIVALLPRAVPGEDWAGCAVAP